MPIIAWTAVHAQKWQSPGLFLYCRLASGIECRGCVNCVFYYWLRVNITDLRLGRFFKFHSCNLFRLDEGAIWLEQTNHGHGTSFGSTRETSDWNKPIMWPLSAWPGSHLIGETNHGTSFGSTREPSDWKKPIMGPLSAWPGSHLIGTNLSWDLFRLDQGAIWLEQTNHWTSFGSTRESFDWNKPIAWPLSAQPELVSGPFRDFGSSCNSKSSLIFMTAKSNTVQCLREE